MGRTLRQILMLLLLALVPALGSALLHPNRPLAPGELRPGEVKLETVEAWNEQPMWVDARPRAAFDMGHIPGAVSLNEDEWGELLPQVLAAWQPGRPVVVYCDGGGCEAGHGVARRLRETGLDRVFVLHNGWAAWKEAHP